MEQKIILRFRNSSKAGTTEELPVGKFPNVTIGRDPSCEVAFDPDKDDLVSRAHTKIAVEGDNFWISDMGKETRDTGHPDSSVARSHSPGWR